MAIKYSNNAASALSASITNSATSFSVTTGDGAKFPVLSSGDYFYATLIDTALNMEIVKVTARSSDTFTVVRGQDGTTARAFSQGDRVELRITKAMIDAIRSWDATSQAAGTLLGKTDDGAYSAPQILDYSGTVATSVDSAGNTNIAGNGYYSAGVYSIRQAILNNTIQVGQNLKLIVEIPTPGNDEVGTGVYDLIDMGTITTLYQSEEYYTSYFTIVCTNPSGFDGTGATWRNPYHIYGFYVYKFVIGGTVAENVFLGNQAGVGVTTGGENVVLGANAGSNIGAGRNNVVIGNAATASASGVDNEVTLGNSSHTKTRLFGALALGGSSVGTSGQVLTSQGPGTTPIWSPAGSGLPTQTDNSGKFLTTDGTTASWATVDLTSYLTTSNYTSYAPSFLGDYERSTNARVKASATGAMGLMGVDSAAEFRWNIYGDGTNYGFLDSTWGNWDLQKAINGQLTLRVSGTQYTALHSGNYTSYVSYAGANQQLFATSGTFTVPAGVTKLTITAFGGGGGGGSSTGGNGGAGVALVTVTSGTAYTVTIGNGGAGGNYNNGGVAAGGTTSFGTLVTATGGGAGNNTAGTFSTTGTLIGSIKNNNSNLLLRGGAPGPTAAGPGGGGGMGGGGGGGSGAGVVGTSIMGSSGSLGNGMNGGAGGGSNGGAGGAGVYTGYGVAYGRGGGGGGGMLIEW